MSLHMQNDERMHKSIDKMHTPESHKKMSETWLKKYAEGYSNPTKGCKKTDEQKHNISEGTKKAMQHPEVIAKHRAAHNTEEYKSNIRAALSDFNVKQKMSEATKGSFWWTDGVENKRSKECPGENWHRGRTNRISQKGRKMTLEQRRKVSERTKAAMQRPDVRKKFLDAMHSRHTNQYSLEEGISMATNTPLISS